MLNLFIYRKRLKQLPVNAESRKYKRATNNKDNDFGTVKCKPRTTIRDEDREDSSPSNAKQLLLEMLGSLSLFVYFLASCCPSIYLIFVTFLFFCCFGFIRNIVLLCRGAVCCSGVCIKLRCLCWFESKYCEIAHNKRHRQQQIIIKNKII